MRLLIVEDEPRVIETLVGALRRAEFRVDIARTAADAAEALAGMRYDAMILDLGLLDGHGLTLVGQVRSSGRHLPLLILTAADAVEDIVRGLNEGADDYLVKPFAADELLARIKPLLRRSAEALGTAS